MLALTACKKPAPPEATSAVNAYTVRGEIVQLPAPNNPLAELQIHHEAIDGFKDKQDSVVGMNSMTMPFDPGEGVALDGLAKGDKIEFTFEAWWSGPGLRTPHAMIREIRKLPADAPPIETRKAIPNMTPEEKAAHEAKGG